MTKVGTNTATSRKAPSRQGKRRLDGSGTSWHRALKNVFLKCLGLRCSGLGLPHNLQENKRHINLRKIFGTACLAHPAGQTGVRYIYIYIYVS